MERRLQLIKNIQGKNVVVNTIIVDADFAVFDETIGPGAIYDEENNTFTLPAPSAPLEENVE